MPTPTVSTLPIELLLHIITCLAPHPSSRALAALSSASHHLRLTLLPTLFSHLKICPEGERSVRERIHQLVRVVEGCEELVGQWTTSADVQLGQGDELRYEDFEALGRVLGRCKGLRRLRIREDWDPARLLGRSRRYGVWFETIFRAAAIEATAEVLWPCLEELDLVGVVGNPSHFLPFLGPSYMPSLGRTRLALSSLIRVYGRFSTGQLAVHFQLPPQKEEELFGLYSVRFGEGLREQDGGEEEWRMDPTRNVRAFLRTLEGTLTVEVGLVLSEVKPLRSEAEERADELLEALERSVPGLKKLMLRVGTDKDNAHLLDHLHRHEVPLNSRVEFWKV